MNRSEGSAENVWLTTMNGWHYAMWAAVTVALLSVGLLPDLDLTRRILGAVTLVVLGVAYATVVQRDAGVRRRAVIGYLAVAIIAAGVACAVHPELALLLFIVYPQVWMFTRTVAQGAAGAIAVTISAYIGFMISLPDAESRASTALSLLVGLGFSLMMGWWVSRIIEQSRDRARLVAELQTAREELTRAHHAEGVVAERERMAREIHDTLAQGFTSVLMLAQAAAAQSAKDPDQVAGRLAAIEDVARENLAEARALVAAFSPIGLDGSTLTDAVHRLVRRFGDQTGLPIQLVGHLDLKESGPLRREQEVVLLRAVQEALTNVRRHAGARQVVVRIVRDLDATRVEVSDDGVGFAPAGPSAGFGLAGMRGRVDEVGGDLDVTSAPGQGTRVTVRLPLSRETA